MKMRESNKIKQADLLVYLWYYEIKIIFFRPRLIEQDDTYVWFGATKHYGRLRLDKASMYKYLNSYDFFATSCNDEHLWLLIYKLKRLRFIFEQRNEITDTHLDIYNYIKNRIKDLKQEKKNKRIITTDLR